MNAFYILVEYTSDTVDLVFKPAQMSESCLTGRSWRAVITEVQESTSISPPPLDVHLDKGDKALDKELNFPTLQITIFIRD